MRIHIGVLLHTRAQQVWRIYGEAAIEAEAALRMVARGAAAALFGQLKEAAALALTERCAAL